MLSNIADSESPGTAHFGEDSFLAPPCAAPPNQGASPGVPPRTAPY